ncbi:NADPH-dependent FMN reductase [Candidatus Pantoea bituminis]|uniref:NADPH-dependent FMN reductase n=1 Tax=Candidatus Pantoea bituminis TaxID=2831036 RepID=UPI001C05FAE3|nr:NAD(P)H-dependent oxidoreductase [Pantoea bituminis]
MNIKIITGSVRSSRVGPQISQWILTTIQQSAAYSSSEIVDLKKWQLPLDDEPYLPATGQYVQPLTRRWSKKIKEGDIIIFVFPQYNAGYPAALKNAIDHLYDEWNAKPAIIVSYANRGGGKAASQMRQVLEGIFMRPLSSEIEIKLSEMNFDPMGRIADPESSLAVYQDKLMGLMHEAESILYEEKIKFWKGIC